MKIHNEKIPLYIALFTPLCMVVLVALFVYVPSIGKRPAHNFMYVSGNIGSYGYGNFMYSVEGGKLLKTEIPSEGTQPPYPNTIKPNFYIYDVQKNIATEITYEQAQQYTLSPTSVSVDGYTVLQGSGSSDMPFFGGFNDYTSKYISGHNRKFKLNITYNGLNTYDNFQFLGWIE